MASIVPAKPETAFTTFDDGQAHALGHDVADAHTGPVQVGARGHGVVVRGDEAGGTDAHGDRLRVGLLF